MALVLTSGPASEPVTLAEAKTHLRVDGSAEDTLIGSLIITSRLHVEAALGLALVTQGWSYFLDAWPPGHQVSLPLRPVQSIAAVKLYAADESVATLGPDTYLLDGGVKLDGGDALHGTQRQRYLMARRPGVQEVGPALRDEGQAQRRLDVQPRRDDEAGDQRVLGAAVDAQVGLGLGERDGLACRAAGEDEGHFWVPSELGSRE